MTTKEFSELFDMSVNEMCEFTGFSRGGLNEIIRGRSKKNGAKKTKARHDLRDLSDALLQQDLYQAYKRHEQRNVQINEAFGISIK